MRDGQYGVLARRRCSARPEVGAVAVEFALVLPLLVMLVLGVTTAGLSYSRALGLTNAVREGARFGATADATNGGAWADNVIARVRATQFDDPASPTSEVCVQLWQIGTGPVAGTGKCDPAAPTLGIAVPTTAGGEPTVPAGANGSCVVRVVAARPFTLNIGLASWTRVNTSASTARYERKDKVPACL